MDQTTQSNFTKKSIPIILSISAFSILFSFSFLSLNDFPNQMRSYVTDRNYIFLFCNGILVLIIKSSGLASSSSSDSESKVEFVEKGVDQVQPLPELAENKDRQPKMVKVVQEEEVRVYESFSEEEEEEDEDKGEDDFFVVEEEGFGLLSTEELNKKCDDFIKKMRAGIKIQA